MEPIWAQAAPPSKLVLLVDDDARTARRLARMLEDDGWRVEVLHDGSAALARLDRAPFPDVVVTDFVMPRASGLAVLERARTLRSDAAVVFVTGHPELLDQARLDREAHAVVLTKPISYGALERTLARLTEGKS